MIITSDGITIDGETVSTDDLTAAKNVTGDIQAQLDDKLSKTGDETVAGVKTFSSSPIVDGVSIGGYSGFKNYIINGGFDVWQRGTSFDVGSSTYTADRWLGRDGVISRSTEVPEGQGFKYSAFYDNDGTRSSINLRHIIEDGLTIFNGMTLSLSYWIKPNINCTINNDLHDTTNLTTDLQANTWTKVTKTWSNIDTSSMTNYFSGGLFIDFNIGGSYPDFYITGVQLEEGSVATPFEQRPYGLELSLCKRYYQRFDNEGLEIYASGTYVSGNNRMTITLPEEMRISPSVSHNMNYSVLSVTSTSKAISFYSTTNYRMDGTGKYIIADAEL